MFPCSILNLLLPKNPDVICISAGLCCFERYCNLLTTLLRSCLNRFSTFQINTFFAPAVSIRYLENSKQDVPPPQTPPFFLCICRCVTHCAPCCKKLCRLFELPAPPLCFSPNINTTSGSDVRAHP